MKRICMALLTCSLLAGCAGASSDAKPVKADLHQGRFAMAIKSAKRSYAIGHPLTIQSSIAYVGRQKYIDIIPIDGRPVLRLVLRNDKTGEVWEAPGAHRDAIRGIKRAHAVRESLDAARLEGPGGAELKPGRYTVRSIAHFRARETSAETEIEMAAEVPIELTGASR